jgi:hypothetical protein
VSRRIYCVSIDDNLGGEAFLYPILLCERVVNCFRDGGFVAPADVNPTASQSESGEYVYDIRERRWKVLMQDGAGVLPLVDFVMLSDESR